MSSRALSEPKARRTRDISPVSVLGYGAGDAANNLAFMTATMFLLVYYTDVVGISAAAAGTLFLVLRLFDAFTDLAVGRIIDKTRMTRLGKFRPYILFGSLPLLLLSVATFSVPQIGETGVLLYAYVTYALLGIAYTFVNIAYGSLAAAISQRPGARAKLAAARSVGGAVVAAALGSIVAPLMTKDNDIQAILTTVTLIFVVIGMALYIFTVFSTKEEVERSIQTTTMRESLQTLRTNKPLMILCGSSVLLLIAQMAKSTAQIYYMRDVFDSLHLMPVLSLSQLVVTFVMAPIVPALVRKFGKRNLYIATGIIASTASLVAFLAPNVVVAMSALLISMPAIMVVNMVIWALEADTVEYGEWKTGVRSEGVIYATFSFTRKAGQAIGTSVAAFALSIGGYVGTASVQTTEAEWGIRAAAALLPAVTTLLASAIMFFYPLTDKVHAEIVSDITRRRDNPETPAGLSTAALSVDEANRLRSAAGRDGGAE